MLIQTNLKLILNFTLYTVAKASYKKKLQLQTRGFCYLKSHIVKSGRMGEIYSH